MPGPTPTNYDEVPYEGTTYRETHPDVLATVARLHGLKPPAIERCRVLEVACAEGTNLLGLAVSLPRAGFLGIDVSVRQIESARSAARELDAENAHFELMNLDTLDDSYGPFDYIIAHGIYSWIPEALRRKLLEVVRANLTPDGVASISFNVRPGWNFRGVLRDLMVFHVAGVEDPWERVRHARGIVETVAGMLVDSAGPYATLLKSEASHLPGYRDAYLVHEHLEAVNDPLYFHEFVEQAAAHGLQYLGDARPYTMVCEQAENIRSSLRRLSPDPLRQEQYFDFLCNRFFRRALLCHEGLSIRHEILPEATTHLRAAAPLALVGSAPGAPAGTIETFQGPRGDHYGTEDPLIRCLLTTLIEARPSSLAFDTLLETLRRRLARMPGVPADRLPIDADRLARVVLDQYLAGRIEFRTFDPDCRDKPGPNPKAAPFARREAASGRRVTNLLQTAVTLSEFERLVFRRLDGKTDRSALLDSLVVAVKAGEFELIQEGRRILEPNQIRPILERSLEPCLLRLAASALLV